MKWLVLIFAIQSSAQEMQSITREEAERMRVAMALYYTQCGFFPKKLQEILEPARKAGCTYTSPEPALAPNKANRILTSKLVYKPLAYDNLRKGFQDYQLWMKVLWIPPASRPQP